MDGIGLGYSYHLPTAGWSLRIRNALSQFSDIFSEFNKYISPAYHHDRCERSVSMRLYSMHKREFVMVLFVFFALFGLGVFIGLAGPPITVTNQVTARKILSNMNSTHPTDIASGPFIIKTKSLSTYNQQLWVIAKMRTENTDEEIFVKSFKVGIKADGVAENREVKPIFVPTKNRTRYLRCELQTCDELIVVHLGFLEYPSYRLTIRFYDLEAFHQRYTIKDITFYLKTYNPAFTQIEIWFRFIFLLGTFSVTCWFVHTLRKYAFSDWSLEQKWVSALLPLLLCYNNPMFPMMFLMNSWIPGMLDAIFQVTFLCALFMFWLCAYHGLRQNERKWISFYFPKIILVGMLWMSGAILAAWEKYSELRDPTFNFLIDSHHFSGLWKFFYVTAALYLAYICFLVTKAYSELRSMPYFDMRLKFLTLSMFIVTVAIVVMTVLRFGVDLVEDSFVAQLTTVYKSSAEFMALYGMMNFYLYTMAYVYSPTNRAIHETVITKDNPAFSMINDSDEDVIYGSDEESRRPLNRSRPDDSD